MGLPKPLDSKGRKEGKKEGKKFELVTNFREEKVEFSTISRSNCEKKRREEGGGGKGRGKRGEGENTVIVPRQAFFFIVKGRLAERLRRHIRNVFHS